MALPARVEASVQVGLLPETFQVLFEVILAQHTGLFLFASFKDLASTTLGAAVTWFLPAIWLVFAVTIVVMRLAFRLIGALVF